MRALARPHLRFAAALALAAAALGGCQGRSTSIADAGPAGPSLEFVGVAATVDCDADAAPDAEGFQLEVALELFDDDGSGYSQAVIANARNGATAAVALDEGPAAATIEVVSAAAPGADNTLTATVTNDADQTLTATAVVAVACEIPAPQLSCAFTAPAEDAVLDTASADVEIACASAGLSAAQRAWLATAQLRVDATEVAGGATSSRELDLVDGSASGTVLLPGTGPHTLTLTLLDPDGLIDPDPSSAIAIDVQQP